MRGEILAKANQAGVLIDPEAVDYILDQKSPLEFFDSLLGSMPPDTPIITPELLTPRATVTRPTKPAPRDETHTNIKIRKNFPTTNAKAEIESFTRYFNDRYRKLGNILRKRIELAGAISIVHAKSKGEKVAIIAMVTASRQTTNGHRILEVEDPTGKTPILVIKSKPELLKNAESLVFDEVVGILGTVGDNIIFCNEIIWPEIPIAKRDTQVEDDVAVAFLSDTHVGSDNFMEKNFLKMVDWLRGNKGSPEQRELAKKISYIIVAGDLIDGVGIYPHQDRELKILDIHKQFEKTAELFSQFPDNIKIVVSPGNHDGVRLPQPQPPIDTITDCLCADNIIHVSNPAQVTLHNAYDVLIYHGVSFDGMISSVPSLSSGYTQPEKVMEELLKRRHLSPSYGMDIAAEQEDRLIIDEIPNLFHCGHVHTNGYKTYRGVRLLNSGAWQSQTKYQKMLNHTPTPCKLPVLSLKSNSIQIINFQ